MHYGKALIRDDCHIPKLPLDPSCIQFYGPRRWRLADISRLADFI